MKKNTLVCRMVPQCTTGVLHHTQKKAEDFTPLPLNFSFAFIRYRPSASHM